MQLLTPQNQFVDQLTIRAQLQPDGNMAFAIQGVRAYTVGADGLPLTQPRVEPLPETEAMALIFKMLSDTMRGMMLEKQNGIRS